MMLGIASSCIGSMGLREIICRSGSITEEELVEMVEILKGISEDY